MSNPLSGLRDHILIVADRAEELGEDATALELRRVAGAAPGEDGDRALAAAVLAWCLDGARTGLTAFGIHRPGTLGAALDVYLDFARGRSLLRLEPGCTPHRALRYLEHAADAARRAAEEHARRNPGISRVLNWRPGMMADHISFDENFIYEGGP